MLSNQGGASIGVFTTCVFASLALASSGTPDAVQKWADCFGSIESIELTWDMDRPTVSLDRKRIEMLRADVFVRARWPDAWDIKVSRVRGQYDAPFTASDPGPERRVFTPGGELLDFMDFGTRKSVRRSHYAMNLALDRSIWFEGGPLLAGKWLHAVGLPQGLAEIQTAKNGTFVVEVPSQRVRMTLVPSDAAGCSGLVLARVDAFRDSGEPDATYEYSDFRVPPTFQNAIGYRRKVTLAPRTVPGLEDLPKSPESREDVLIDARIVPRFSAEAFDVSTAGFTDVSKPKQPPRESSAPEAQDSPKESSDHKGASTGLGTGWLPGFGIGLIVAAGYLFARSRFRSTS